MKRIFALIALCALLLFSACAPNPDGPTNGGGEAETVELTLWTYPIGGWANKGTVSSLLTSFHRDHPDIHINVTAIDYVTGDSVVEKAIADNALPDLIFEGPERLVANWGARGRMVDIRDLWEGEKDIYESVRAACHDSNGNYYVYPLCMTTHCMAINRDLFEKADAWQYIDEETHTWSTQNFIDAVKKLRAYGIERVGAVYCGGQGGDQGTRALVNNLYGGTFTNEEHTQYTVNSEENIRALELLKSLDGIVFDDSLLGADEIAEFAAGNLAMAFCWNSAIEVTQTISGNLDFDVFPMAFPTEEGDPALQGGIWGFGIFDNGDETRIRAAKTFIRYMTSVGKSNERAVIATDYFPVRDLDHNLYENDTLMSEYGEFRKYLGDYYQVTRGWAGARTAWWNMLKKIGEGEEVKDAVAAFTAAVNT